MIFVWVWIDKELFLQERKDGDGKMTMDSDDELGSGCMRSEIEAGVAPFTEVLKLSPSEKAMMLLQQKLPVAVSGEADAFAISPDQYNVVVLAIAPLQRLWDKAQERQLLSCFGDPAQTDKLLELVTPVAWCPRQAMLYNEYFFGCWYRIWVKIYRIIFDEVDDLC